LRESEQKIKICDDNKNLQNTVGGIFCAHKSSYRNEKEIQVNILYDYRREKRTERAVFSTVSVLKLTLNDYILNNSRQKVCK
jgi:hypothetical protein